MYLLSSQQDEVLSELKEYARSDPLPDDAPSVEMVISYLEALNGLFEKSILGQRVRIFDSSGSTIQSFSRGKWVVQSHTHTHTHT